MAGQSTASITTTASPFRRKRPIQACEGIDSKRPKDQQVLSEIPAVSLGSDSDDGVVTLTDALNADQYQKDGENIIQLCSVCAENICLSKSDAVSTNQVQPEAVSEDGKDLRTGIVAESGSLHFDRKNKLHRERPARIASIMDAIEKNLSRRVIRLENSDSLLDRQDLERCHLPSYIQRFEKLSGCACTSIIDREAERYDSLYLTSDSFTEARKAASSLCKLVTQVMNGNLDNGFAVIRPPGHHAEPNEAGGYSILNNVAIAASYAKEKLDCKKILIVDWDIHHGNSTQKIFWDDPNVLYFSAHRWHGGNFFPFRANAGPGDIGGAKGYNINVAWNKKGMGDDEYLAVWDKVLLPVAKEFDPDLVLVSAGFDAAEKDMGECDVTPEGFKMMTRGLMGLANGRVVCSLEGGYVRSILGECVSKVVSALLDPESARIYSDEQNAYEEELDGKDVCETIDQSAAKSIRATTEAHSPYWKCFQRDGSS